MATTDAVSDGAVATGSDAGAGGTPEAPTAGTRTGTTAGRRRAGGMAQPQQDKIVCFHATVLTETKIYFLNMIITGISDEAS